MAFGRGGVDAGMAPGISFDEKGKISVHKGKLRANPFGLGGGPGESVLQELERAAESEAYSMGVAGTYAAAAEAARTDRAALLGMGQRSERAFVSNRPRYRQLQERRRRIEESPITAEKRRELDRIAVELKRIEAQGTRAHLATFLAAAREADAVIAAEGADRYLSQAAAARQTVQRLRRIAGNADRDTLRRRIAQAQSRASRELERRARRLRQWSRRPALVAGAHVKLVREQAKGKEASAKAEKYFKKASVPSLSVNKRNQARIRANTYLGVARLAHARAGAAADAVADNALRRLERSPEYRQILREERQAQAKRKAEGELFRSQERKQRTLAARRLPALRALDRKIRTLTRSRDALTQKLAAARARAKQSHASRETSNAIRVTITQIQSKLDRVSEQIEGTVKQRSGVFHASADPIAPSSTSPPTPQTALERLTEARDKLTDTFGAGTQTPKILATLQRKINDLATEQAIDAANRAELALESGKASALASVDPGLTREQREEAKAALAASIEEASAAVDRASEAVMASKPPSQAALDAWQRAWDRYLELLALGEDPCAQPPCGCTPPCLAPAKCTCEPPALPEDEEAERPKDGKPEAPEEAHKREEKEKREADDKKLAAQKKGSGQSISKHLVTDAPEDAQAAVPVAPEGAADEQKARIPPDAASAGEKGPGTQEPIAPAGTGGVALAPGETRTVAPPPKDAGQDPSKEDRSKNAPPPRTPRTALPPGGTANLMQSVLAYPGRVLARVALAVRTALLDAVRELEWEIPKRLRRWTSAAIETLEDWAFERELREDLRALDDVPPLPQADATALVEHLLVAANTPLDIEGRFSATHLAGYLREIESMTRFLNRPLPSEDMPVQIAYPQVAIALPDVEELRVELLHGLLDVYARVDWPVTTSYELDHALAEAERELAGVTREARARFVPLVPRYDLLGKTNELRDQLAGLREGYSVDVRSRGAASLSAQVASLDLLGAKLKAIDAKLSAYPDLYGLS
ncbi:MAG: hypothetical protein ACT4PV_10535, partial [Planctomycetaceae bacterium]